MLMATARRYTMEQIETARKKLRSLPVKEAGKTRAEVAEFLVNDIKKAMRQGYSLQEIKDVLAQSGISVSLAKMQEVLAKSDVVGESSLPKKTEADITCCPAKDTLASVPEASPPTMAFNDMG